MSELGAQSGTGRGAEGALRSKSSSSGDEGVKWLWSQGEFQHLDHVDGVPLIDSKA